MPAQKAKVTSLLSKLGGDKLKKAHAAHAGDQVDYGNQDLPDIANGVAQLSDIKFGQIEKGDNKGKLFFRAAAVIKSPTHVTDENGKSIKVEGRTTSIMENLFDTPGKARETFDDHYAWVLNEIKKIGGEECCDGLEPEQIEMDLFPQLLEAAPYIRFTTRKGEPTKQYPNPRTFHNWFGACEAPDGEETADVVDDTGSEASSDEAQDEADAAGEGSSEELTALAEAADGGDETACETLTEKAKELGIDEDAVTGADNWAAVVELIQQASAGDGGEAEEEEVQELNPAKGETYKYQPTDPKTKKPAVNPKTKKPLLIECDVTAVDKKTKTVTLRNNDDNKTLYKSVAFDKLIVID